jgi:hypothetical protein
MTAPTICRRSGKLQFASARDASAYLAQWRTRAGPREELPKFSYRCPDCHCWHLTRVAPERTRKARRAS